MGIPPHIIMHGMPAAIMDIIAVQRSFIISICDASIGMTLHVMPSLVISQVIRHIMGCIGIMPGMPII
jgi:hypothetical protein